MLDELVADIQRSYPQIYLACHGDHVRSRDASILSPLDRDRPTSPRDLASHLGVVPSTLSATLARLQRRGYLSSERAEGDGRRRELRLTARGADAMASTSVLDTAKLRRLLERLNAREREAAVNGLAILARAAVSS